MAANGNGGNTERSIISMTDIKKSYKMGKNVLEVLHGINLSIEKNDYVSIIGPSGSGKSTLMNIIGCLDTPSDGDYVLDGRNVRKLNVNRLAEIRNRNIGFVFQSYNLLTYISAQENVELPMIYKKIPAKKRRQRARELLSRVGLEHRLSHKANELSGGEMQRVAIARALANEPSIILADEPTGNLDSSSGKEIMGIFDELWRQGNTIIIITHDPNVADRTQWQVRLKDGVVDEIKKNGFHLTSNVQ